MSRVLWESASQKTQTQQPDDDNKLWNEQPHRVGANEQSVTDKATHGEDGSSKGSEHGVHVQASSVKIPSLTDKETRVDPELSKCPSEAEMTAGAIVTMDGLVSERQSPNLEAEKDASVAEGEPTEYS